MHKEKALTPYGCRLSLRSIQNPYLPRVEPHKITSTAVDQTISSNSLDELDQGNLVDPNYRFMPSAMDEPEVDPRIFSSAIAVTLHDLATMPAGRGYRG